MIVPSLTLRNGRAVSVAAPDEDLGEPRELVEQLRLTGEIAVFLPVPAAEPANRAQSAAEQDALRDLLRQASCRVGIVHNAAHALELLDAGAAKVIVDETIAPDVLRQLPADRVVIVLRAATPEAMRPFPKHVGGFQVAATLEAAELAALDQSGVDAQLDAGPLRESARFADALAAPLKSDRPDGLWPTVVVDEHGVALGLAYSSRESLREAVRTRRGVYHSRTRGLWRKGETSGAAQELLRIELDCDRDALRFTVKQHGPGFCHQNTRTCWGEARGLPALARRLAARQQDAPLGSYTQRLFQDADLLRAKLLEEAAELAAARTPAEITHEAADILYFALVALARAGVPLAEVEAELDRRALKISRRPGNAKNFSSSRPALNEEEEKPSPPENTG